MRRFGFRSLFGLLALMFFVAACGGDEDAESVSSAAIADVETFVIGEVGHTDAPVTYDQSPPVGGDHKPNWLNCGFFDGSVQNEYAVHALEHGAVWITYQPGSDDATLNAIRERISGESHLFASEYADQDSAVVMSAWGAQLALDDFGDARVESFVDTYEQSQQSPEPGAPCSGGVEDPS